jgi:rSAM/selenodomain-associated transferase 1
MLLTMEKKKAIILFVRHPEKGRVKTRLARDIGDERALEIYKRLLGHTQAITQELDCDRFVFYADAIVANDIWEGNDYRKRVQAGDTLGERMKNAFAEVFDSGYQKVVIIGSDCPQLSSAIISDAFKTLDTTDVVIGPATDGGYYLLALKYMITAVFENKQWSTDTVLTDTVADLEKLAVTYSLAPVLRDIDTGDDLVQLGYSW